MQRFTRDNWGAGGVGLAVTFTVKCTISVKFIIYIAIDP
jgi:hypothetical protein